MATTSLKDVTTHSCSSCSSSSGDEISQEYEQFYSDAQWITGLICYPIICVLGIVGNILIMIVLARPAMRQATYVFLAALAVADTIKLINDFLYFLTILLLQVEPTMGNQLYGNLYPYAHFVFNVTVCVASWLTVSVAVERYILIVTPLSNSRITLNRAVVISTICYLVMVALAVPSAYRYRSVVVHKVNTQGVNVTEFDVQLTELWQKEVFVNVYTWTQSLIRSIVPLFLLIVLNSCIINAMRKTRGNRLHAAKNRITLVLIIVIIFFVICILPDAIMSAFFNYGYAEDQNLLVKGVREITDMLLAINASINFMLYIAFNTAFREEFLKLFCAVTPKKGRSAPATRHETTELL